MNLSKVLLELRSARRYTLWLHLALDDEIIPLPNYLTNFARPAFRKLRRETRKHERFKSPKVYVNIDLSFNEHFCSTIQLLNHT